MRFIIFNIIVGAGLIYLFNGGQLPLDQMKHGLKQVQAQVKKAATIKPINDAELSQKRDKENNGQGHDIIPQPTSKPSVPPRDTKPENAVNQPASKPSKLETSVHVETLPVSKPKPAVNPTTQNLTASKVVAERRAQVLAQGKQAPVTLKAGTSMMGAGERRHELNSLVEEMEMIYIERVGG